MAEKKPTCFIITPIGPEGSDIRRHIDGIIEASIKPVLGNDYEVKAAHHISASGNILDQIIKEIEKAQLVIVNLTNRNPNVMYELGVCHTLRKPTIMIAEQGTENPSDITMERTIYYQYDMLGSVKLQKDLKRAIEETNFQEPDSPVYSVLKEVHLFQSLESQSRSGDTNAAFQTMILDKINSLEESMRGQRLDPAGIPEDIGRSVRTLTIYRIEYKVDSNPEIELGARSKRLEKEIAESLSALDSTPVVTIWIRPEGKYVMVNLLVACGELDLRKWRSRKFLEAIMLRNGFEGLTIVEVY